MLPDRLVRSHRLWRIGEPCHPNSPAAKESKLCCRSEASAKFSPSHLNQNLRRRNLSRRNLSRRSSSRRSSSRRNLSRRNLSRRSSSRRNLSRRNLSRRNLSRRNLSRRSSSRRSSSRRNLNRRSSSRRNLDRRKSQRSENHGYSGRRMTPLRRTICPCWYLPAAVRKRLSLPPLWKSKEAMQVFASRATPSCSISSVCLEAINFFGPGQEFARILRRIFAQHRPSM